jgi:hypothetical protein
VNVSRPQQTFEACWVELSATRERCEAQAKELEDVWDLRAWLPKGSHYGCGLW